MQRIRHMEMMTDPIIAAADEAAGVPLDLDALAVAVMDAPWGGITPRRSASQYFIPTSLQNIQGITDALYGKEYPAAVRTAIAAVAHYTLRDIAEVWFRRTFC